MSRTAEEKKLLEKFFSGVLDGQVGRDFVTTGGSTIWTAIKDNQIVKYKQGPSTKFFNGKENERIAGVLHTVQKWVSEDEILAFFQKYGFLIDDVDVKKYSAKFKGKV